MIMTDNKLSVMPQLLPPLITVGKVLAEMGVKSYLVGGVVRDMLLGRFTADIDIAVSGDARDIAQKVATRLAGRYVLLDEINRVARVIAGDGDSRWQFDFSGFNGSIESDLARRDFTVNAMAVDLSQIITDAENADVIDPFGGTSDLEQRLIRAVSDTAFVSDAVRLLRAVRLVAELKFTIESHTEALIRLSAHLVASVAGERVREELLRLLATTGRFLSYLDDLGLLTALIPELVATKGAAQPPEHFWDVFNHTLETVDAVDWLLRQGDDYGSEEFLSVVPWSEMLAQHFADEVSSGSTRRLMFKVAALLHDIAKPQTKSIDPDGRMRFLGHPQTGAELAAGIMARLRFSVKETKLVELMVRHHLRPGQTSQSGMPTARAIYRYFRDTGDAGIDVLFLSLADHFATRGPYLRLAPWQEHCQLVSYVLAQQQEQANRVSPLKLVDGHDLINIFGLSPGPRIREILEAVQEAHAAGELTSREEALSYIRDCFIK